MTDPLQQPVICPILIGRSAHIGALERLLAQVRSSQGTPRTVLIAGEAGIGKSRLVAEARTHASQLGFTILQGSCFESDRALPYAPVLDLLHTYCLTRTPDEIALAFGSVASQLVQLLPELSAALPDLTPAPALEPEQEKHRLFQALVQFLTRLAANQPLLVIIEDAHWSDETSLEFLLYLARRMASHSTLLILTYRNDEISPALNHFLAALDRERLATEFTLTRLTTVEVDGMLRAIFDLKRPVRAEFLASLFQLTEGNPFFIEEILKSLVASGEIFYAGAGWDRKPLNELHTLHARSVQDAVQRRVEQLSPAARRIADLAAVAGQRFDFTLLQDLARCSEEELLQLIKELIAAQLVVEDSAEQFAFRHALTRQAIYSRLLARERQALHRVIAEAWERLYAQAPDLHLADLAYHYFEAGAWEKALYYSQRAGEKAQSMYAPRAAVEHLSHALAAAQHLAVMIPPALYHARGQAYETLGDFEAARSDYEQELQTARTAADRQAEWQALIDLGFLWAARDYARTGEYFQQALALVRTLHDPSMLGYTLNRVGNWCVNVERSAEALRYHREALDIFEELNDRRGLAQTLDLLGLANFTSGNLIEGSVCYRRAIELFRELDDRVGLCSALATFGERGISLITDLMVAPPVTLAEAQAEEEEAVKIAQEIGWRSGEAYALIDLASCLISTGQYARALESMQTALAIAQEIEHLQWMTLAEMAFAGFYYDLLAYAEARQYVEQAIVHARESGSLNFIRATTAFLASACIHQNDLPRAEALLASELGEADPHATLDRVTNRHEILTMSQRQLWLTRAELAVARGDPSLALYIIEQLMAAAAWIAAAGQYRVPHLVLSRAKVLLRMKHAASDPQLAEALADLEATRDMLQARGAPPILWRIRLALGKFYQAQNRHPEADQEFMAVRQIVEDLAANVPDHDLRDNFLKQAMAMIPPEPSLSARQVKKKKYGGLTERERQVAACIAQGKSNREIAEALFLGERTIETHVSNILSKLGFDARTQIAAWAVSSELTQDNDPP